MSRISKITLPDGNTYDVGADLREYAKLSNSDDGEWVRLTSDAGMDYNIASEYTVTVLTNQMNAVLDTKVDQNVISEMVTYADSTYAFKTELPDTNNFYTVDEANAALAKKVDTYLDERTYTDIIATANAQNGGTFWFFQAIPKDMNTQWKVKFEIDVSVPSNTNYHFHSISTIFGWNTTQTMYHNMNALYSTSYRPVYYESFARLNAAGFSNGYGHMFGCSLQSSTNPTSSSYKRTITVRLLEVSGIESFEFYDTPKSYSDYSATYYAGINQNDFYNNGLRETGDDNSIDRLYYNSLNPKCGTYGYGTQMWLSADGITYNSICTSRGTGTTKKCYTGGFNPAYTFLDTYGTTIAAGASLPSGYTYRSIPIDFRYSSNLTTLTAHRSIYLIATYNDEDGLYYLKTDGWMTQTLPTEEDGYYYIMVGQAYNTTSVYFNNSEQRIFRYINGAVRTKEYADMYDLLGVIENGTY